MHQIENNAAVRNVEITLEIPPEEPLARLEFSAKLIQQTTRGSFSCG
jgi:hypothetical protein